jgi:hypothetical protein
MIGKRDVLSLALLAGSLEDLKFLPLPSTLRFPSAGDAEQVLGVENFATNRALGEIHQLPHRLERVYFGNEFCQRKIPMACEVAEAYEATRGRSLAFSLLTPFLTASGLERIRPILQWLGEQQDPELEVVVNEFGLLNLVAREYPRIKLVLGRLLNKMKRMPRFNRRDVENLPPGQYRSLSSCSYTIRRFMDFLRDTGVQRVEFDPLLQDLDVAGVDCPKSIYFPWSYITLFRVCEIGSMHQPGERKFMLAEPCRHECRSYHQPRFGTINMPPQVIKGNAAFMCVALRPMDYYGSRGFDRIVFQPRLPN